ncbi:MAG: CPBP family glutamic-type intramembrane protease [Caulobacteraceae bacterium]
MAQTATATPPSGSGRWPILLCLGLILAYSFYSVAVQRSAAQLAPTLGGTGARVITEGAIWLYASVVLAIALFWERQPPRGIGLRRFTLASLGFGIGGAVALFVAGQVGSFVVYTLLRQPAHSDPQVAAMVGGSVVYAIFLALRAGVIEEVLFRGLAIEQLTTLTGNRLLAAGIAVVVFIAVHCCASTWRNWFPSPRSPSC